MQSKNIVYIYQDEGVSEQSLKHTIRCVEDLLLPKYRLSIINASMVKTGKWMKDAALLIMPGGADTFYSKNLNGKGNRNIKYYVEQGGSYLGICAGAYYGSSYVEFDKAGKLEILGKRELSFFPGKSIGPVIASYDYNSNKGSRVANVVISINGVEQNIGLFFNGGPYFESLKDCKNTSTIAWYYINEKKEYPAIIHINFGKGKVILSGVHFEYDPSLLNKKDIFLKSILFKLKKENLKRKYLTKFIFGLLNITQVN